MILYHNSNKGLPNLINNRFVFQEKGGETAQLAETAKTAEKAELPDKVVIKMAQFKAKKEAYNRWAEPVMETFGKQTDNLKKYLNLKNPEKVTNPATAYRHLAKLLKKMETAWKREQLERVKASGQTGVVDVGNYTYEYSLSPAPCKPLSKKEQTYLKENGKKMPEGQIRDYQNLAMDFQMELVLKGEKAFRGAAEQAGINMSQVASTQVYDESQMAGEEFAKQAKRRSKR